MKRLSGQGRAAQKSILMVVQACPLKVIMVGKPNSVNVRERHLYLSDDFLYKEILLGAKTCHCNRSVTVIGGLACTHVKVKKLSLLAE